MKLLGLIGKDLTHSFSGKYFSDKFEKAQLSGVFEYRLFEIPDISHLFKLIEDHPDLFGLNVTIPYKEAIIPMLDQVDQEALEIGSVNTVVITRRPDALRKFSLTGFNTDAAAFEWSLKPMLKPGIHKALVLGTGGASKAICYSLRKLQIDCIRVSRKPSAAGDISYDQISRELLEDHLLIVNTTPVGTFPRTHESPDLPYHLFTSRHLLYDLVYNPPETVFLRKGREQGAAVKNGYDMLVHQAEASWTIWNNKTSP